MQIIRQNKLNLSILKSKSIKSALPGLIDRLGSSKEKPSVNSFADLLKTEKKSLAESVKVPQKSVKKTAILTNDSKTSVKEQPPEHRRSEKTSANTSPDTSHSSTFTLSSIPASTSQVTAQADSRIPAEVKGRGKVHSEVPAGKSDGVLSDGAVSNTKAEPVRQRVIGTVEPKKSLNIPSRESGSNERNSNKGRSEVTQDKKSQIHDAKNRVVDTKFLDIDGRQTAVSLNRQQTTKTELKESPATTISGGTVKTSSVRKPAENIALKSSAKPAQNQLANPGKSGIGFNRTNRSESRLQGSSSKTGNKASVSRDASEKSEPGKPRVARPELSATDPDFKRDHAFKGLTKISDASGRMTASGSEIAPVREEVQNRVPGSFTDVFRNVRSALEGLRANRDAGKDRNRTKPTSTASKQGGTETVRQSEAGEKPKVDSSVKDDNRLSSAPVKTPINKGIDVKTLKPDIVRQGEINQRSGQISEEKPVAGRQEIGNTESEDKNVNNKPRLASVEDDRGIIKHSAKSEPVTDDKSDSRIIDQKNDVVSNPPTVTSDSSTTQKNIPIQSVRQPIIQTPQTLGGKLPVDSSELIDKINLNLNARNGEISLQLKPGVLGKAMILLQKTERGLDLKFDVDNSEAHRVVEAEIPHLREVLQSAGFSEVNIDVRSNQQETDRSQYSGQSEQRRQQDGENKQQGQSGESPEMKKSVQRRFGYNTFDIAA